MPVQKKNISRRLPMGDWPAMVTAARRMANLTQEDFAADLGGSRSVLGHWENGRRPIPSRIKRRILDFMGGYYRHRPEFNLILAGAENSGRFVTLYRQGAIIQDATSYAKRTWWQSMQTEMLDQPLLHLLRQNMRFMEFYEKYYRKMLANKNEIASVSYVDESLLFPEKMVESRVTAVHVGEGRILCLENIYLPIEENRNLLNKEPSIITMDDVGGD